MLRSRRVYWQDERVPSVAIRPYIVYGPGRDRGMTAGPTQAMAAAAHGERFTIGFSGTAQYDYAPDVGLAFALASRAALDGAHVTNFPGVEASMDEVVGAIEAAAPEAAGRISYEGDALPFPPALEARGLERLVGRLPRTPLSDGVRATVECFRRAA